jgi:hypothetical protein
VHCVCVLVYTHNEQETIASVVAASLSQRTPLRWQAAGVKAVKVLILRYYTVQYASYSIESIIRQCIAQSIIRQCIALLSLRVSRSARRLIIHDC